MERKLPRFQPGQFDQCLDHQADSLIMALGFELI